MRKAIPIIFFMLSGITYSLAQHADSLLILGHEVISNRIEHLEAASEAGVDLSELTGELELLLEKPININTAGRSDLKKLGLLNDIQVKNIIDYREKYGIFYSIYELKAIDGLSRYELESILPFTVVEPPKMVIPTKKRFTSGIHELIIRYQRKLISPAGYTVPPDSLQAEKAGSYYLGNPDRYLIRYRYKVKDKLSMGFTAEKDPGELFLGLPGNLTDTVKKQLGKTGGFDFYSGHLAIKNLGFLKSLILGDYHMQCGQGLVLWSGLSFGGSGGAGAQKRYPATIKENTSSNENLFMRGIAGRIQLDKLDLSLFYSQKNVDANILDSDMENNSLVATSLQESGYHRTLNELADKNALLQVHYGGHITYSTDRLRLGMTAFKSHMDPGIFQAEEPGRKYMFRGSENFNAGVNFDFLFRKTNLFGEAGYSMNGGWALLTGLSHTTNGGSIFGIRFREYRKDYQNLMAGASGKRDGNANEHGFSLSIQCPLHRTLSLQLFSEHIMYPWLTSRSINVYRGQENELVLYYKPRSGSRIQLRYRHKKGMIKANDDLTWLDEMRHEQKQQLRLQIRQSVSPSFFIKCQFESSLVKKSNPVIKSHGSMLLLDLFYHPLSFPLKLSFRYALFNTDDHDSRLYAYEHDVLYASSMPAYSGKGFRSYFLIQHQPLDWMNLWLRISLTTYTDRNVISSGTEEINGNKQPEIKIQMRIKF